jgi:NitT/TauT family transport system substrate-binding protein
MLQIWRTLEKIDGGYRMSDLHYKALCIFLAVLLIASNVFWILTRPESQTIRLNFAYQVGFHYGVSIIMDHFDLVEKHSRGQIEANYFKISGGSTINEAIVAGSIDFAQMGTPPAIKGIDQGIGTKILASFGSKEHEAWTWRSDVQSLADLEEGDVVCVVKLFSIEHVGLIKAFLDMGKTREQADAISGFFSHSDAYQMMDEGAIDVDFTGVPYTLLYAENPRYHKISGDTEIWGMPLAGGVFIGRATLDKEIIDAVLDAWMEAVEWIKDNPQEASEIIGPVYDYTEEEAWELWQESGIVWNATFGLNVLETQSNIMYQLEITDKQLNNTDLLFPQTLEMMK